ncbi:MAG: anti-sigma factor [Caldilineaceae bacterium]
MNALRRWRLLVTCGFLLIGIYLFCFMLFDGNRVQAQAESSLEAVGSLNITESRAAGVNAYQLTLSTITPPPAGSHYELWLTSDTGEMVSLGVIPVTDGQATLEGNTNENLLAYTKALISVEPDDDSDAGISNQIAFSSAMPEGLASALQSLYWKSDDGGKGAMRGAYEQMQIVVQHRGFLEDALADGDLPTAFRHAEHIINILAGKNGLNYGDHDRDGSPQNPGDDVGVEYYLTESYAGALPLIQVAEELNQQQVAPDELDEAAEATETGEELVKTAYDQALKIFAADTITEAQQLADDLSATIDGLDHETTFAYTTMLELAQYQFAAPAGAANDSAAVAPTVAPTNTPEPTATPTAIALPINSSPDGAEIVGSLNITESRAAGVNAYQLAFGAITPPPAGSHYELWLASDTNEIVSLGAVPVTDGQAVLAGNTNENLLAYTQALVSLEADDDSDAGISDQIVFASAMPEGLASALQSLYWKSADGGKGAMRGAYEQMQIVVQHRGFLQDALADGDLPTAFRHAEHLINILAGKNGLNYGDHDRDGSPQNPGDDVGVEYYLTEAYAGALPLIQVAEELNQQQVAPGELDEAAEATETGEELVKTAYDQALKIFAADTITEAQQLADDLGATIGDLDRETTFAYTTMLELAQYQFAAPANDAAAANDTATAADVNDTAPAAAANDATAASTEASMTDAPALLPVTGSSPTDLSNDLIGIGILILIVGWLAGAIWLRQRRSLV